MKELTITTTDRDLIADIEALSLDGVAVNNRIRRGAAIITSSPTDIDSVITFITKISEVAVLPLLIAWLKERIKNKKNDKISINGVEISRCNVDVNVIINNINANSGNSGPKEEE